MRFGNAAVIAVLTLVGCASGDASAPIPTIPVAFSASAVPSATPIPTSSLPSPEPASPSPAPTQAAHGDLAIFVAAVNGLRLRAGPSLAADPLHYRCTGIYVEVPANCMDPIAIDAGRTMVVFDGPVAADGFDWYLVVMTGTEPGADQLGWVATPHEGDAWLVPSELECPTSEPDPAAMVGMGAAMAVHCYQGHELTFEGWVVTGFGCGGMGVFEPMWLAHPCANMSYIRSTPTPSMGDQQLFLHYPAPGVTNPTLTYDDNQRVRIVGHYDDPVARECVIEPDPNEPAFADGNVAASDRAADVAVCRMRFVVTEVTALP